jgi:hypothetical protein
MNLLPGCRLAGAPRFHLDSDWAGRVSVGAGVDSVNGKFFPRGPWRAPTPDELAALVWRAEPLGALPVLGAEPTIVPAPDDALCLFSLPEHLRAAWWALLDASADAGGPLRGFDHFAGQVSAFLAFKQLGVPTAAQMEAIVTAAGERSIRRTPDTGEPSGLGSTIAPWAAWPPHTETIVPRLRAIINLGDESTGVVWINLPFTDLAAEVVRRAPDALLPNTVGALVEQFLGVSSDYPPVRVRLGAGEGCRIPACGLVLDGDPAGKAEPDVLLLISAEE